MLRTMLAGFAGILVLVNSASAGIVSSSGVEIIAPPPSVEVDALESDSDVRAFRESSGKLSGMIALDITNSGTFFFGGGDTPVGDTLPTGTDYVSYFLHADPESSSGSFTGSATFKNKILGLIIEDRSLDSSDSIVGNPGTAYPTGVDARGLEITNKFQDTITLDLSTNTVSWDVFDTFAVVDSLRVVTVPEPSTIAMGLTGLTMAGGLMLRRRRRA